MIKKRNLDNSLIQWIMSVTGLGPGVGEMFWVAPTASSTSQFKTHLTDFLGVSDNIYAKPSTAEEAMVTGRNDVMLVMPGAYAETASITWDKDFAHIIGLAGPRSWSDYSEPGVSIYTTTAAVAEVISVTGDYTQFLGINFGNNAANTGNLAAFKLSGYGGVLRGCSFDGAMNTTSDAGNAGALYIYNAHDYVVDDCRIGDASWWTRDTANCGQLVFMGTESYNGLFKNCLFQIQSATATCCLVKIQNVNALRLDTIFENCLFTNMNVNWAGNLNQVFYQSGAQSTARILLKDCAMSGFDEWQDSDLGSLFQSNMGVATAGGGICIEPTATIS